MLHYTALPTQHYCQSLQAAQQALQAAKASLESTVPNKKLRTTSSLPKTHCVRAFYGPNMATEGLYMGEYYGRKCIMKFAPPSGKAAVDADQPINTQSEAGNAALPYSSFTRDLPQQTNANVPASSHPGQLPQHSNAIVPSHSDAKQLPQQSNASLPSGSHIGHLLQQSQSFSAAVLASSGFMQQPTGNATLPSGSHAGQMPQQRQNSRAAVLTGSSLVQQQAGVRGLQLTRGDLLLNGAPSLDDMFADILQSSTKQADLPGWMSSETVRIKCQDMSLIHWLIAQFHYVTDRLLIIMRQALQCWWRMQTQP